MAGFPHHQLESYLGKLIAAGMRAAVCEQVEDPKLAKGLVRREVTRVVTPGTRHRRRPARPARRATSWRPWPRATRRAWPGSSFPPAGSWPAAFPARQLADQLARIAPAECLLARRCRAAAVAPGRADDGHAASGLGLSPQTARASRWPSTSARPVWRASALPTAPSRRPGDPRRRGDPRLPRPRPRRPRWSTSTGWSRIAPAGTLEIDEASRRSLEITRTIREGRREGSLLGRARPDGHRHGLAAAGRLAGQSADRRGGDRRRGSTPWRSWWPSPRLAAELRETLRRVYDVERLLARVTTGRASPRDLSFLGRTLRVAAGAEGQAHRPQEPRC